MQSTERTKATVTPLPPPSPRNSPLWSREHLLQAGLLASGVIYSVVTLLMWWAARDSLALTRDQVLLGERAYLIPQQVQLVEPLAAGHPVKLSYAYKNSGSTPASHCVRCGP